MMKQKKIAPYGAWKSPISSDLIVADTVRLGNIVLDGKDSYWLESRPSDKGRSVIVRHSADGEINDMTASEYSVVSRVHEYGGGAYTVRDGEIYFVNLNDQGIYRQTKDGQIQSVMISQDKRFADLLVDAKRERIICICEEYQPESEPENTLVAIDINTGDLSILAEGADFYASPTLSSDGDQLAWLCWHHPNMPWDGTELRVGRFNHEGRLSNVEKIAGGPDESIFQPQWGPDADEALYFVSDRSGWWNLYRWQNGESQALQPMQAEFGLPQWVFGMSTYGFDDEGNIICAYRQNGDWQLARLQADTSQLEKIDLPYTSIDGLRCQSDRAVFIGGSPTQETALVELKLVTEEHQILRRSSAVELDAANISVPQAISFASSDDRTAHAFYYPPCNAEYEASEDELPPLLVKSHGGPTASTDSTMSLAIQFWTSRGFAVVDVNYGGSTGYGRTYHQQLDGLWGVVDIDDCVAAVNYLNSAGKIDKNRCAIRGSSAGGYTTLAALTFTDTFCAGASYYGISDLEVLAQDTHKFESRYLDRLIGSYPETIDLYKQRSPINHIEQLSAPVIFFQGLEDKVVPPNQAQMMVDALDEKGIAVAYVPFAEERHGFRQAKNIKHALEAELYFYSRIFGFDLSDMIEPVEIKNLP